MKPLKHALAALAGVLLLSTQAGAFDYEFHTAAPADYYGGTAYEEVYGAQYNYGGHNTVDFLDPLTDAVLPQTNTTDIEYGLSAGAGGPSAGGAENVLPGAWMELPVAAAAQYTDIGTLVRSDGSIGTLVIPKRGIRYRAHEGTDSATMSRGVGHFPGTTGWNGNISLCGHNRGSSHNIGSIRNLSTGDTIQYETSQGTRTYCVSFVGIIEKTDWSYLEATSDNRITIITCLADQPAKRVCVQAQEVCS